MNNRICILSIDDDDQISYALGTLFRLQNWETLTAKNVEQGIALYDEYQPDIILIDYHMPKINGIEGVKMLRKRTQLTPIIVFTIDENQEVADTFLAAGASDFALKPIRSPDIVARIKTHLNILQSQNSSVPVFVDKGIAQGTLKLIDTFLTKLNDCADVNEIAQETGISIPTVYRYLQYMTQKNHVEVVNEYGKVGRPKQKYRIVRN